MTSGSSVVQASRIATSTTAAQAKAGNGAARGYRLRNLDGAINVFVGFDPNLTTENGFLLGPGETQDWPTTSQVWLVAESGTPEVNIAVFIG